MGLGRRVGQGGATLQRTLQVSPGTKATIHATSGSTRWSHPARQCAKRSRR